MSAHYVYIIAHSDDSGPVGPVKVGITKSPGARLASIQTGNWRRVEIVRSFKLSNRAIAHLIESTFHDYLAEHRLAGEWFGIEPFDAMEALCNVVFEIIESTYGDDDRTGELVDSGAVDALKEVTDFYWGPHH
jgi:hypothetical protein